MSVNGIHAINRIETLKLIKGGGNRLVFGIILNTVDTQREIQLYTVKAHADTPIGCDIAVDNGLSRVIKVAPNSPCFQAGLR